MGNLLTHGYKLLTDWAYPQTSLAQEIQQDLRFLLTKCDNTNVIRPLRDFNMQIENRNTLFDHTLSWFKDDKEVLISNSIQSYCRAMQHKLEDLNNSKIAFLNALDNFPNAFRPGIDDEANDKLVLELRLSKVKISIGLYAIEAPSKAYAFMAALLTFSVSNKEEVITQLEEIIQCDDFYHEVPTQLSAYRQQLAAWNQSHENQEALTAAVNNLVKTLDDSIFEVTKQEQNTRPRAQLS